ncbi:NAD-dependent epimerase/dehydratase family protein [Niallia taxi]|nr:NAD-dependent epimerase/dehydratase family protein [Niallia taxi]MDE5053005.1 NAD-dependent epimerase/dehydratase family protein [Niallia taxi]
MNKTILITGASGFTGIHACRFFAEKGYYVYGAAKKNTLIPGINQLLLCDLANEQDAEKLIKTCKPDYLLHLAGQNHVGDSWDNPIKTLEINAMSTAYLLQAAAKHKPDCKMLIVGSALQTNPQDISAIPHPYSLSKTIQTTIALSWAHLFNLDIMVAKPTNLIGPGNSNGVCAIFIKQILESVKDGRKPLITVQNINATRDFIDVRDAVSAYEYILLKGKSREVYDITTGVNHSLGKVLEHLEQLSGRTIDIKSVTSDVSDTPPLIDPVKLKELGWQQERSLTLSLADMLNYFQG